MQKQPKIELENLQDLYQKGLISKKEYEKRKSETLNVLFEELTKDFIPTKETKETIIKEKEEDR